MCIICAASHILATNKGSMLVQSTHLGPSGISLVTQWAIDNDTLLRNLCTPAIRSRSCIKAWTAQTCETPPQDAPLDTAAIWWWIWRWNSNRHKPVGYQSIIQSFNQSINRSIDSYCFACFMKLLLKDSCVSMLAAPVGASDKSQQ